MRHNCGSTLKPPTRRRGGDGGGWRQGTGNGLPIFRWKGEADFENGGWVGRVFTQKRFT